MLVIYIYHLSCLLTQLGSDTKAMNRDTLTPGVTFDFMNGGGGVDASLGIIVQTRGVFPDICNLISKP